MRVDMPYEIDWSTDADKPLTTLPRRFTDFDEAWETARKIMDLDPDAEIRTILFRRVS
jgi:hypothetical protein